MAGDIGDVANMQGCKGIMYVAARGGPQQRLSRHTTTPLQWKQRAPVCVTVAANTATPMVIARRGVMMSSVLSCRVGVQGAPVCAVP
jgi:hypothetical protein